MEFTISQIANLLNGEVSGDGTIQITGFAKIEEGSEGSISFLSNPKYESYLYSTKSSAVIVDRSFVAKNKYSTTLILVDNAYSAISILMSTYKKITAHKNTGIEEYTKIDPSAKIDSDVYIGSFSYISENCNIGNNSQIYPNAYLGKNVKIGKNVLIFAGVKIYDDCVIGDNCILHSGAVIGADGFGFAPDEAGIYQDIPQLGNVVLAENVSIGANATVDRATMGSTKIGKGTKIDNHVQIGHNVEIGENTVIAALTGIAGSTKIGSNCVIAGLVGIGGHIKIANGTKIGGHSGVSKSITTPNQSFGGRPLLPINEHLKLLVNLKKLNKKFEK